MRIQITKGLLVLTTIGAFAGLPALAEAKHGADDPAAKQANDQRRGRGADDATKPADQRRGRGTDDPAGHR